MRAKTIIVASFMAFILAIVSILLVILFSRALGVPSRDLDRGMTLNRDPNEYPGECPDLAISNKDGTYVFILNNKSYNIKPTDAMNTLFICGGPISYPWRNAE